MLDLYGLPTKGLRIKIDTITTTGLSASGWLKRDKLLFALIRIAGGGAGGDDLTHGGGGGAYCEKWYRGDELDSTENVTVGAGGAITVSGESSIFKDMTAGGGSTPSPGTGGIASGGDLNINGNDGLNTNLVGASSLFFNFGAGGAATTGGTSGVFIAWNFIAGD